MGLDMYLEARRFISSWDDEGRALQNKINSAVPDRGDMDVQTVICEAAYWRKANQIHKWFVDNVQEGKDDCGTYYVDREQLTALHNACKRVLDKPNLAKTLLPCQSGFFFGGTDIDEGYFDDLKYTVERLDEILKDQYKIWQFSYHSSW